MTDDKLEQKIAKQYDGFYQKYIDQINVMDRPSIDFFYSKLENIDFNGKKVLDIGCGAGLDLLALKDKGAIVYGIDPSEEFIKKAKLNVPDGEFIVNDMNSLPYANKSFKIAISKYSFQNASSVENLLNETARVLEDDGLFICLSKHPTRQFLEKDGPNKDYFVQGLVTSRIFNKTITLYEPSHTIKDYLNPSFLKNFRLIDYDEGYDFPASEQINGDIYPCFFTIKAIKMPLQGQI